MDLRHEFPRFSFVSELLHFRVEDIDLSNGLRVPGFGNDHQSKERVMDLRRTRLAVAALLGLLLCVLPVLYSTDPAAQSGQEKTQIKEITVWVNTSSGVYHCPGTRWYGNTKQGEFTTQKKAQEAGNRPAYGEVCQ